MEKLKLPIIRQLLPPPKSLSMDDYLRFVTLHLKYTFNRKNYRHRKKLRAVNVRFSIKECVPTA